MVVSFCRQASPWSNVHLYYKNLLDDGDLDQIYCCHVYMVFRKAKHNQIQGTVTVEALQ